MAGLAAYFLGRSSTVGNVSAEMLDRLLTVSRPISPRSRPNVIWNGQDGSNYQDLDDADLMLVNASNHTNLNVTVI